MAGNSGWIGVDLDGTLAEYHGWKGVDRIGKPIPAMVERVKKWLEQGREVRIFTARVYLSPFPSRERQDEVALAISTIDKWCIEIFGQALPITNIKDFGMIELWDDRAVRVKINTGEPCCGC